jgi:hypothetical protein
MRARRQAIAAPLVAIGVMLVTLASMTSCRQVVGIADPEPPPRCSGPAFATAPSCDGCLLDHCCAELDACQGDPLCRALLACVATCADDTCRAACEAKTALTESAAALFACQGSRCDSACGLSCGGVGTAVACKPCGAACCAEGAAFRADLDAQRLRACRAACRAPDVPCREACLNVHATGADLELAASECVTRSCGVVGRWACLGRLESRKATAPALTLTFVALDVQTNAPIAGVKVKGCSSADLSCTPPPFGSAVTDAAGRASITVGLSSTIGIDAYPGFLETEREGYPPHLLYFVPALTADRDVPLTMAQTALQRQLEQLAGVALAPDRGAVIVQTFDCAGKLAVGATVRAEGADDKSSTFYFTSTSTGGAATFDFQAKSTSEVGLGGVFNVPAGPHKVTARVDGLCADIASATVGIRPGALTIVFASPSP